MPQTRRHVTPEFKLEIAKKSSTNNTTLPSSAANLDWAKPLSATERPNVAGHSSRQET